MERGHQKDRSKISLLLVNDGQIFLAFLSSILISNRYNWRIRSNGNHTKTRKNSAAAARSDVQTWRKFRKGNWRPNGQTQGYSNQGGPCIVWIFAPKITLNVVENKPIIMQIIWIFALKIIELVAGLALVCVKLGAWVTTCKAWQKSFADKRN